MIALGLVWSVVHWFVFAVGCLSLLFLALTWNDAD